MANFMLVAFIVPVVLLLAILVMIARQYRRCPSNRILVVYGKVGGERASRCLHGGGVFIIPLIQGYEYLSLEPITIEIELTGALSKKNIRVNVPSTFTVGISTDPTIMYNAAERLLGLSEPDIKAQSSDIILGQLRLVIATLSIEEINQDREKFLDLVNQNVNTELNKIGLEVINVNIRDITDESGYIDAIGRRAAAEAINVAKVEVAHAEKNGAIGESTENRERTVEVANQSAQAEIGKKKADREQRITISKLEAEGIAGEAEARREQEVAIAIQEAKTQQGQKEADAEARVFVAQQEASAIKGENLAKAEIATYQAQLKEREAETKRRSEVALAHAQRDILRAEQERETASLERDFIVKQEIEKRRIELEAEANAARVVIQAQAEAEAVLKRYQAEAQGQQAVLEAKGKGYERLLASCADQRHLVPTLLLVEKLPELIEQQVKAVQNLKIDKITVWDSPANGSGSTANFMRSLVTSVPALHDLAEQVGMELPSFLGKMSEKNEKNDKKQTNSNA